MRNAHAAPAVPASPTLTLLGAAAESNLKAALKRFQTSIQDLLDSPLDAVRVAEWSKLRSRSLAGE